MTDPFFAWVTSSLLCETEPTQPRNPWAGVRWRTVNPSIDCRWWWTRLRV